MNGDENMLFVNKNTAELWFHFENSKHLLSYSIPYLLLFFSKYFFFFFSTKYNKRVFNVIRYTPIRSSLYFQDTTQFFLRVKFTNFLARKIYFDKKFIFDDLFYLISPSKNHNDPLTFNSLFIYGKIVSHQTFKNFILIDNFFKNTFAIWDITSDRIILEIFLNVDLSYSKIFLNSRCNFLVWVENYILNKKKNKIFHQWLIKNILINFNREIYFKYFSSLKKKILSKTSEKRRINLKYFNLSFSFSFFKNSNSEINLWGKNFQENWTTYNSEYKTLNGCKINKKNTIIFLSKFLKAKFNYLN